MPVKTSGVILAAFATLLLLVGCSAISEGYITNKTFTPAYMSTWIWCHPVGKVTICQPMTTYYPDSWEFDIKKGEDTGFVSVNEGEYDSYEVGEYYPAP